MNHFQLDAGQTPTSSEHPKRLLSGFSCFSRAEIRIESLSRHYVTVEVILGMEGVAVVTVVVLLGSGLSRRFCRTLGKKLEM